MPPRISGRTLVLQSSIASWLSWSRHSAGHDGKAGSSEDEGTVFFLGMENQLIQVIHKQRLFLHLGAGDLWNVRKREALIVQTFNPFHERSLFVCYHNPPAFQNRPSLGPAAPCCNDVGRKPIQTVLSIEQQDASLSKLLREMREARNYQPLFDNGAADIEDTGSDLGKLLRGGLNSGHLRDR